jgi:hypothetical protein
MAPRTGGPSATRMRHGLRNRVGHSSSKCFGFGMLRLLRTLFKSTPRVPIDGPAHDWTRFTENCEVDKTRNRSHRRRTTGFQRTAHRYIWRWGSPRPRRHRGRSPDLRLPSLSSRVGGDRRRTHGTRRACLSDALAADPPARHSGGPAPIPSWIRTRIFRLLVLSISY